MNQPRAGRVDATGTRRRLDALACLGHPSTDIAALMGRPAGSARTLINRWRNPNRPHIARTIRDQVATVYEQLHHRRGRSSATAIRALEAGCLPPAAWDGVDIDDPTARPRPRPVGGPGDDEDGEAA